MGVDRWPVATATYADNFPKACTLAAEINASSTLCAGLGPIDLILASPECTNHTCARGSRARDEASRETALHVLQIARRLRPRWLVVENVVQMRSWARYPEFLGGLQAIFGRDRVSAQVLDAVDFGVPQSRRRLFVLCDALAPPPDLAARQPIAARPARDILDPPGTWPRRPLLSARRAWPTLERARRAISVLGEGVPFLIVYYGSDGSGGWQPLDRPLRTLTTLDRFGLVEWDTGTPTLRMLQVPELRRAMGFDNSFRLHHGSRRERIMLLGNAVCPPVMRAIVAALTGGVVADGTGRCAPDLVPA